MEELNLDFVDDVQNQIDKVLAEMKRYDAKSDEYKACAENLQTLMRVKTERDKTTNELWRTEQELDLKKDQQEGEVRAAIAESEAKEKDSKRGFWGKIVSAVAWLTGLVFAYFASDIVGHIQNSDVVKAMRGGPRP